MIDKEFELAGLEHIKAREVEKFVPYVRSSSGATSEQIAEARLKFKILRGKREKERGDEHIISPRYDDEYFETVEIMNSYEFWSKH